MADTQEERLQNYIDAEKKTLVSQEYQSGNKRNRRADLTQIREGIDSLLAAGAGSTTTTAGSRARRIVLRDL